ncbi:MULTISPECIES: pyridoxamine 5'-phosphate oxidase family protein [Ramlibacter]|uniref:Pyridoxamine 5'-phosphate oxidase family protein n=1 Tax=Ramlibacter aquaticus TaxID=2780094 RepID=A0ABR9S9L8_9BURK|nr:MULTISPECIES: pyridoxamine 5'-phosphate oxidase family protein [Ramlibacter]MBE7939043.1 pyridoxamine 5'-phosphate oxidase family protein [Ramlibacter aquaticus]
MSTHKTDPHQTLWEMIKSTRFGMLTHRHPDGGLHSHPLTTQNKSLEDDMLLYFFVSKRTELGQRLRADGNVNVAYANTDKDRYVSVSGEATVNEDMDKKRHLFNAMAKAWFPGGVEDPDLELVQVRIHHAEYWDVKESKTTQLFKMAAAAVSGKPPHMGEHRELHTT